MVTCFALDQPLLTHHLVPVEPIIINSDRELKLQVMLGDESGPQTVKSLTGLKALKAHGLKTSGMNALLGQVSPAIVVYCCTIVCALDSSELCNLVLYSQSTSSLGWLWLVPAFHLPSPTSTSNSTAPRTHTLEFTRELIDFRSKSMRSVKIVFEEVSSENKHATKPADDTTVPITPKSTSSEGGSGTGEIVPEESQRPQAVMLGDDSKTEGGEHA